MGSLPPDFLSVQDRWQLEALHWAAARGDGVVELLAAGANVHTMDNQAQTPLFLAAQNGQLNAVVSLLGAGAQDRGNWQGDTAASRAVEGGYADVVKAFVESPPRERTPA